ncbi:MAG: peptidoglycan DD-metalloendopeptidase family protein [Solirubrobacterales bacterium]|nr:peptidoglycan DD-metalloendopeptidase family protein [Solirubrobacterales bacterium]
MTKRLLLTIALGAALAVITAGVATSATVDLGGELKGEAPAGGALPACADLTDNDADGSIDQADVGCESPLDEDEYNPPPVPPDEDPDPDIVVPGDGTLGPGAPDKKPGKRVKKSPDTGAFGNKAPKGAKVHGKDEREKLEAAPIRNPDGSPSNDNPSLTIAQFGAAPIGVPNFVIDQFEIPPFLLPIYQACGTEYGVPWQILASINRIETAFGTNLNVSSAGALGWMQFIPSSWQAYGVDANEDGRKDPYNPVDAICAAARYLKAAGWSESPRDAIFAYNHADWYVDEVLLYANQYGKLPDDLVGSLTGLTEGAHFPVAANARYADDISEREALRKSSTARGVPGNAADVITESPTRRGINIYSRVNAPVVAVNDGVIIEMGTSPKLGKHIVLQDAYGNRYTYAQLGELSELHPVPKDRALTSSDFEIVGKKGDSEPADPATAGANDSAPGAGPKDKDEKGDEPAALNTEEMRERLFALPERPANSERAGVTGQLDGLLGERVPGYETFKRYFSSTFKFDSETMELRELKVGSNVTGGTVLGRIGEVGSGSPHVHFAIKPAGRGAPRIDPKPILDGWKLLETTAIYRAAGKDPFGTDATIGQILLMSKEVLAQRVLADPHLEIYSCGRSDIESGQVDRRTLAVLEYLAERGYRLTITSLKCGHSFYTSSGNVSAHSSGNAVDIAQVNGLPILGNQGAGSVTEAVVKDLLLLQGTMRPAQIITLMEFGGPTFAMSDHDDHIHVGYTPAAGAGEPFTQLAQVLKPDQWERLIDRLGEIDNPEVPAKPSDASLPAGKGQKPTAAELDLQRGSDAHRGE